MGVEQPLFEGRLIRLGPIDMEKDPEVEARWTHDPHYLRMLSTEPARPLAAAQVKKKYEAVEKRQEDKGDEFYFTVRHRDDDRLLGFVQLQWIEWSNAKGVIVLGIGAEQDRGCGYGSEALQLGLRFAFDELNLYRLSAMIPEYNRVALHLFQKAGFVEEVRRRQAFYRDGRRWDAIHLSLLQPEYRA